MYSKILLRVAVDRRAATARRIRRKYETLPGNCGSIIRYEIIRAQFARVYNIHSRARAHAHPPTHLRDGARGHVRAIRICVPSRAAGIGNVSTYSCNRPTQPLSRVLKIDLHSSVNVGSSVSH